MLSSRAARFLDEDFVAAMASQSSSLEQLGRRADRRCRRSSAKIQASKNGPRHGLTRAAPGAGPLTAAFGARAGGSADLAGLAVA